MRKIYPLPGGIHPPENKSQSLQSPIAQAGIPPQLILPLAQHIGAPAKPIVSVGDTVLKGQLIAEAAGFVSVPLHAPSSGTISAIGLHAIPHPSGMDGACITIDTDGHDTWTTLSPIADYTQADKATLLAQIRNAGIAGMGGAGFPTAVKLTGKPNTKIKTLIINGTECEPYITADDSLMQERAKSIINGIIILSQITDIKEVLIGIEDNKPAAIKAMKSALSQAEFTVPCEIISFPTKYPSGGEKQLIQILTGQEVPSGGLPSDIGIVLQNIGTAYAIHNAVTLGQPLISRITTVTGASVKNPQNFEILIGTPMQYLLDRAHVETEQAQRLIMGGPMMGFALEHANIPLTKTSNCILAPSAEELPEPHPQQACIRCGLCVQACPASLLPQQMYWFSQAKEVEKLRAHNIADCIECGACSYVCPSSIPLVQYFRSGKAAIRQADADAKEAEHAKIRFDARIARLEREQAEKDAKRKARLEKAAKAKNSPSKTDDAVAAAMARVAAKKAATETEATSSAVSDDPVQAAIARAKAKRAGSPADDNGKLDKLKTRLSKAEQRLGNAQAEGDANIAAFEAAVSKLKAQIDKIEADPTPTIESAELDPVQAAIAKAKTARAAGTSQTPQQKRDKLQARLTKAQTRLADAQVNNDANLSAFETAVAKLEQQLTTLNATIEETQ